MTGKHRCLEEAVSGTAGTGGSTGNAEASHRRTDWSYKCTVKKKFGLTDNQIEEAIATGLVRSRQVKNPHYSSAHPSTLLNREDVTKNLNLIKALQKYSEYELGQRRRNRERTLFRDELETICPICDGRVRALRGSKMFEEAFEGRVLVENAKEALLIAHVRHEHTDYEAKLDDLRDWDNEGDEDVEDEWWEDEEDDCDPVELEYQRASEYEEIKQEANDEAKTLIRKAREAKCTVKKPRSDEGSS